ncbi:DUF4198 domain-containing protein [Halioxenophilus aromaticivorans]|uniref:DUF4198 domain-containing protein n=1 Tax=Halioxenophilus aromaticivorans TaxID=1306992 RepID=A0AAV3U4F4_9ALTE
MRFKKIASLALLAGVITSSINSHAHRAWLLPASTTLSGESPWVGIDAAVSNDVFHADYHALGLGGVTVTGPKGESVEMHNQAEGKHRSIFDLNLTEEGTYKIAIAMAGLSASWETEDGERRRWPGRGQRPDPAKFDSEVPKEAKNLKVTQSSRRIETFVTAGAPSDDVLAATGVGLELVPVTHPNDLYQGEAAEFRFLIDGKPAKGVEVTILPGGMRYRSSQDAIEVKSDKKGLISVEWPIAGMYFIEAEYADDKAKKPATSRAGTYFATVEVLPQ